MKLFAFHTWTNGVEEDSVLYCSEHVKLVNQKAAERTLAQLRQKVAAKKSAEIAEIHGLNDLNQRILAAEKDNPPAAILLKKLRAKREEEFFGLSGL